MGIAACIAGLSISEMIDELGNRKMPVVRYGPGELEAEIAYAMQFDFITLGTNR